MGTVYAGADRSNLVNCLDAVDECDALERVGHWAQEFYDLPGIQRYVEGQFKNAGIVKRTVDYMRNL